jgi:hypothetical protein
VKKLVHLKDAVYGGEVYILFEATQTEVETMMERIAPRWTGSKEFIGVGCTWEFGPEDGAETNTFLVATKKNPTTPYGVSILVHELLHVTQQLLDATGMRMGNETVEAYCYFLDALVRDAMKSFKF